MNSIIRKKISNGVVIENSLLNEAGIRNETDIIVHNGAIFILPVVKESDWNLLTRFGTDAEEGKLKNPSINHDLYLYGENE